MTRPISEARQRYHDYFTEPGRAYSLNPLNQPHFERATALEKKGLVKPFPPESRQAA